MLRLFATLNAKFLDRAGRTLLSIAGIALGVALGFAVSLINRAAVEEMAAGMRSLSGEADLEVRGGRAGFPETLYPRAREARGRRGGEPGARSGGGARGRKERAPARRDRSRCAPRRSSPRSLPTTRRAASNCCKPDVVFLSAEAAEASRCSKGAKLQIVAGLSDDRAELAGVLPASSLRGIAALTDVATAQWRLAGWAS